MHMFIALVSESLQNIFAAPADICDATLGESARELCNNATHRFRNQIVTDAIRELAENWIAAPPSVAQYVPGTFPGWVSRMGQPNGRGRRRSRAKAQKSLRVNSQGKRN